MTSSVRKGCSLEDHVLVAAGRKKRSENIKPKPAPAAVLPKIELHLSPEGKLRNFRVQPPRLVQSQVVRPDEVADAVAKTLFVGRKPPVLFLQIIIDRGHLEPLEAVGLVDLEDLPPEAVEGLVPVKMILAVGPPVPFLHSEVLGDRLGVELQSLDDQSLGISLPPECLHLSEHRLVDHPVSCKVFPHLTGDLEVWEFHLP